MVILQLTCKDLKNISVNDKDKSLIVLMNQWYTKQINLHDVDDNTNAPKMKKKI